jgi:hypothetical protein
MAIKINADGSPIDATNPDNLSDKVLDERETRKRILNTAKSMGCEIEMRMIFDKFDRLCRLCKNDSERIDLAKLGAIEVYALLGRGGNFYINNQLVYAEKKD